MRSNSVFKEQYQELVSLSAEKNVTELAKHFNCNRKTIYYHLYRLNIIPVKRWERNKIEERKPRMLIGQCKRCEVLLSLMGGNEEHCEDCLNEMGMI